MAEWLPIESAPQDGSVVRVKRVFKDRIVKEGDAVFGILGESAPGRSSIGADPLGRLSAADYAREASDRDGWAAEAKWLTVDRMYAFPTPTHWLPAPTSKEP